MVDDQEYQQVLKRKRGPGRLTNLEIAARNASQDSLQRSITSIQSSQNTHAGRANIMTRFMNGSQSSSPLSQETIPESSQPAQDTDAQEI